MLYYHHDIFFQPYVKFSTIIYKHIYAAEM